MVIFWRLLLVAWAILGVVAAAEGRFDIAAFAMGWAGVALLMGNFAESRIVGKKM